MKGILEEKYKKSRKYDKAKLEYINIQSYNLKKTKNLSINIDLTSV